MRKLRQLVPGATYDVASEIDHGDPALRSPVFKEAFLDFVVEAKKRFSFALWNFTIMDNRIHFLIRPGEGASLSKIMQWIKCNFAKSWNKAHRTRGHLWGERFSSKIIENEEEFQKVSEDIDTDPVRVGLVKKAETWRFGGLFHRLRKIYTAIDRFAGGVRLFPQPAEAGLSPG